MPTSRPVTYGTPAHQAARLNVMKTEASPRSALLVRPTVVTKGGPALMLHVGLDLSLDPPSNRRVTGVGMHKCPSEQGRCGLSKVTTVACRRSQRSKQKDIRRMRLSQG